MSPDNHTVACPAIVVAVPQRELGKKLGHAPGHKKQLQQLWEKEDGLIGIRFNPKTFFKLHDMNDDSFFDRKLKSVQELRHPNLNYHTKPGCGPAAVLLCCFL